jgi:hypothetical protein
VGTDNSELSNHSCVSRPSPHPSLHCHPGLSICANLLETPAQGRRTGVRIADGNDRQHGPILFDFQVLGRSSAKATCARSAAYHGALVEF